MPHLRLARLVAYSLLLALPAVGAVFQPEKLKQIDTAIEQALAAGLIPGAVLHLEASGETYVKAYGYRALRPEREPMTLDTLFDLASLTKVVGTAPAILRLVEQGSLSLDQTVHSVLPSFHGQGKDSITLRQLLTHTSGLPAGFPKDEPPANYEAALDWISACKPLTPPDQHVFYGDLNFILLGEILQRKTGESLEAQIRHEIWAPLRMWDTRFRPDPSLIARIAPTEEFEGRLLRGTVHDPTCRRVGGIAGHAGGFGSVGDIARFARMMLHGGELDGVRILSPATVKLMTTPQSPKNLREKRGLGWDIDSSHSGPRGKGFKEGVSYGHTGFTGTSIWIDPSRDAFLILLTSRLHARNGEVRQLRYDVATLAAAAIRPLSKPESRSPKRPVLNGIDVLEEDGFRPLAGKRVGLITNHTGLDRAGRSTIDLLHKAPGVQLRVLFGPEHGIRGQLDQPEIPDGKDDATGLPVFSLFGEAKKPSATQLSGLDALVFDIQDSGCRFYTYVSTMSLAMQAAAEKGLAFYVLDRVNPIGGTVVDGPSYVSASSFTACHNISIQHGMTAGELARMFRVEKKLDLDLTIVPVAHWKRAQRFDETGLRWVNPSPNLRSLDAALLYPGIGLLEFMNLSVGRGTETPFQQIGAPYLDASAITAYLAKQQFPGIRFEPIHFTPSANVFSGVKCHGVRFLIADRDKLRPIDTALAIAQYLMRQHPEECQPAKFNNLLVHPSFPMIQTQASIPTIRADWADSLSAFRKRRERYLLYP